MGSETDSELRFLNILADECERAGTSFASGRAVGIREAVKPLLARLTALEAALKAKRAEVDAWRGNIVMMSSGSVAITAKGFQAVNRAMDATDAARKECPL